MNADRFSWLHLTDLHYGLKGQDSLWPTLREAFFEDLPRLYEHSGPWQAVLFTGDLVQSGSSEQFAEMQRVVLEELWEELRKLGSGDAILLAVPGNHDLCRPDPKTDDPARDTLLRKDGFAEIAEKFWDNSDGSYRKVVNSAFAAYLNWWNTSKQRPVSGVTGGILPGDFSYTFACGDRSVGIIGLNTTFLQLQGGNYERRLVWDARQIQAVSGGAIDHWLRKHHLCLLMTHQGPDWLTPQCEQDGDSEIAPAGRFAAHLFGHMHETKIVYQRIGGGEPVRRCQCRSVFGMEMYGDPPSKLRSHGYAAGAIEFRELDATFRLWPRIATRGTGKWRFVADNEHAELHENEATKPDIIALREVAGAAPAKRAPTDVTTVVTEAAARSSFVSIPQSNWPDEFAGKFEMPDSMLLRPESRVVRFNRLREPLRDTIIQWAIEQDQPIKLRLQAGEGGAGKTRLLIEVCDKLEKDHGWRAGFVERSQSIATRLPALFQEGKPCLLVLDYAESRSTEIVELVRTAVYAKNAPPMRLVLLARDGGDWWNHLADAAGNDKVISAILQSFQTKAGPYLMESEGIPQENRAELFDEALQDFATFKRKPVPAGDTPNLSDGIFADPLFIHLAAIARLRGEVGISEKDLLGMALGHERSYWRRLLDDAGLSEKIQPALEQVIALLTLYGGKRSARETKAILARAPAMKQVEASDRAKVFDTLRQIYPLEGGLDGLQPDLLGETLVSQALEKDDELLDAVFDEDAARGDSRYALTVLTRLGRRVPAEERWLKRALERRLNALSEDALDVGIETGEPMPKILAEVVKAAERHERRRAVDLLRPKLPKKTRNLTNLTVEIRQQSVSFLENKKTGKGAKRDIALTDAFSALALALRNKGQLEEAALAAIEASRHAASAFRSNTEQDRRRLGAVLANLSNNLGDVGRFEEALKAAEQAEG
ncbi:MAG: metallophosphoesterase family protein, partial [Steroidobacteraceae bacterium]